jgi:hypothetical protein
LTINVDVAIVIYEVVVGELCWENDMLSTYQAVLRGEVLEWLGDKPQNLTPERAIPVYVTILKDEPPLVITERGLRMAAALEQLAHIQTTFSSLDPLQWERDLRQEHGYRSLPCSIR